jgi:ABC-type branched-subunit amino acid transport system ATPase component
MLFPTLTVEDAVRLALEKTSTTRFATSLVGARHAEREKADTARELVELLGLVPFAEKLVGELSTGTRRIAEMCCLLALRPRVLLLDEPSSGIAQRETEALRELLVAIKARLDTTLVVIEHDMPLIMGISDRVYCLEAGRVIAEGRPTEVRNDPAVIASYLGTDERAIARSGAVLTT